MIIHLASKPLGWDENSSNEKYNSPLHQPYRSLKLVTTLPVRLSEMSRTELWKVALFRTATHSPSPNTGAGPQDLKSPLGKVFSCYHRLSEWLSEAVTSSTMP